MRIYRRNKKPIFSADGRKRTALYANFTGTERSKRCRHYLWYVTRLRVTVNDTALKDQERINQLGATAALVVGENMQAIFGSRSDKIKTDMQQIMDRS